MTYMMWYPFAVQRGPMMFLVLDTTVKDLCRNVFDNMSNEEESCHPFVFCIQSNEKNK